MECEWSVGGVWAECEWSVSGVCVEREWRQGEWRASGG